MKKWLIPLLLILLLTGGYFAFKHDPVKSKPVQKPQEVSSEAPTNAPTVEELLKLTNEERAKAGVPPLANDPLLNQSAQAKADDMHNNNYYGHDNPTTGKQGYSYIPESGASCPVYYSENIAGDATSDSVIQDWLNSAPHRKALLGPYESVGFGISSDPQSGYFVVAHFCDKY